jgi:hypothetical protein
MTRSYAARSNHCWRSRSRWPAATGHCLQGDRLEEAKDIEGVLVLAPAGCVDPFGDLVELRDE